MHKRFFSPASIFLFATCSCVIFGYEHKTSAQTATAPQTFFPSASEEQRKAIKVNGQIFGPFRDAGNNNRLTTLKLSFADTGTGFANIAYATEKDAIYEVAARFTSPTNNISAVAVGQNTGSGQGLSIIFDKPTNVATVYGTVPGAELNPLSLPWETSVKPVPFGLPDGAAKESKKEGYSFWGVKTGQFVNLNDSKTVTVRRDVNADDNFGELAVDYQGDYVLQSKKPFKVFGFVTQEDDPLFKYSMLKDKMIVCMLEVPQTRVRLRGMIQGRKAVQATLGWAVY